MSRATPKFAADAMLGRLAKWLRLLGFDTAYAPDLPDAALLARARREGRILLTRDTRLLRRRNLPPHVFVRDDDFRAQLRQVIGACGLEAGGGFLTRCAACNRELRPADRSAVRERVPPYVFATQEQFALCPDCGRVYWGATHVARMAEELRRILAAPDTDGR